MQSQTNSTTDQVRMNQKKWNQRGINFGVADVPGMWLKEESANITTIVLDNLISESENVNPAEVTTNEQKVMENFLQKQDSIENMHNMEDIVLSDVNEEDPWKLITGNEQQITRIGGDHKEHIVHDNFNDIANYDGKEEFNEMNDISDNFSISEQTSKLESFQGNISQIKQPKIKLNEVEFMMNVSETNDSEDVGNFSNSIINLTTFTNRKLSTNTNESDHLSMICIPDDNLIPKKESAQNVNILMGVERKNVSTSERDIEAFVQSNKMYANDVSSSSTSDSDEAPEIIISTKNHQKILNITKESGMTDISMRKQMNTKDEDILEDDK
uniref:Uncharacterized protein n=1 Tax=Loa loa TaxID=7209 RepID=A0A1I7VIW9_LOALO